MLSALGPDGDLFVSARHVSWLLCLSCIVWAPSLHAVPVSSCTSSNGCQQAQIEALVELYTATQGSQWRVSEGWSSLTSTTSISTVCAFLVKNQHGWCCDGTQSLCPVEYGISFLVLWGNNLKGTLPASFFSALGPTLLGLVLSSMELNATALCCLDLQPL